MNGSCQTHLATGWARHWAITPCHASGDVVARIDQRPDCNSSIAGRPPRRPPRRPPAGARRGTGRGPCPAGCARPRSRRPERAGDSGGAAAPRRRPLLVTTRGLPPRTLRKPSGSFGTDMKHLLSNDNRPRRRRNSRTNGRDGGLRRRGPRAGAAPAPALQPGKSQTEHLRREVGTGRTTAVGAARGAPADDRPRGPMDHFMNDRPVKRANPGGRRRCRPAPPDRRGNTGVRRP